MHHIHLKDIDIKQNREKYNNFSALCRLIRFSLKRYHFLVLIVFIVNNFELCIEHRMLKHEIWRPVCRVSQFDGKRIEGTGGCTGTAATRPLHS
jgi:hypothetical protein